MPGQSSSIIFIASSLLICPFLIAQDVQGDLSASPKDYRANNFTFDTIDFSSLIEEAQKRKLGLTENQLENLVEANFRFIFFNKLNKRNFLVTPEPEQVVEKTVAILRLNGQLETLIREGRKLAVSEGSPFQKGQLVRDMAETARRLGQIFRDYFLEIHESSYRITFRSFDSRNLQFVHYLIQSDRINRLISQELDHYFFDPAPGAIDLTEYDDYSIAILSDSVLKLSTLIEKKLRP